MYLESYLKIHLLRKKPVVGVFLVCVGAAWGPVCPQQDHSAPSVGECPVCALWKCPPNWSSEVATGRGGSLPSLPSSTSAPPGGAQPPGS